LPLSTINWWGYSLLLTAESWETTLTEEEAVGKAFSRKSLHFENSLLGKET